MKSKLNRRAWIGRTASTAMALSALSYRRVYGANERLNVGSVGTGGKGWSDLTGVAASPAVQVTALCDIDHSVEHLGRAAEKYPNARRYADWRKLLDESKDLQAVIVSTPDFMHAPVSLAALHLGKHVFCQKPLTHTVFEARQMQLAATKFRRVTQMGNQIQSHAAYRTAVKIVHDGLIGKVASVHSWQAGNPKWPRNIDRPTGVDSVPSDIHWDLWTGVALERPYKAQLYHPFNWRGWRDYGTGQLGDFGCHILDPVFNALQLTAPTKLVAEAPPIKSETWTDRAIVRYMFPATERTVAGSIQVTWYDGVDLHPTRDLLGDVPKEFNLPGAGSVLIGERGSLLIPHVGTPKLFPEANFPVEKQPQVDGVDHYVQWADACRGVGESTSNFAYSGPLTETVLLGTIAVRLPGEPLEWNASSLQVTNSPRAQEMVKKPYRRGWEPTWV